MRWRWLLWALASLGYIAKVAWEFRGAVGK